MRSPGRPGVNQRESKQAFWKCIAEGLPSETAALACGVSQPLARGGFERQAGWHRSVWRRSRAVIRRSLSVRSLRY